MFTQHIGWRRGSCQPFRSLVQWQNAFFTRRMSQVQFLGERRSTTQASQRCSNGCTWIARLIAGDCVSRYLSVSPFLG